MKRKRASEIFGQVDPGLNVIDGGTRHRNPKRKARDQSLTMAVSEEPPVSTRHAITEDDWEAAVPPLCPNCQQETLQLINGICPRCGRKVKERTDQEIEMNSLVRSLREQRARNRSG